MMPFPQPIAVSRPALPSLARYAAALQEIWDRRWLTNAGPVLRRFEAKLSASLHSPNLTVLGSCAAALQVALQGLQLRGEVVTTPFSFAATSNAVVQSGLVPVFADIEPEWLTLDPDRAEAAITPRTCAILAVHVYGMPCALDRLQAVADRHGLPLIYDAAHAFGATVGGRSIATFGDISVFSFHATKLFHAVEGGALSYRDPALRPTFEALANHGLTPSGDVVQAGFNGKMSELHALMGELMLDDVAGALSHGAAVNTAYRQHLAGVPGLRFLPAAPSGVAPSHSYVPVLIDEERFGMGADQLAAALRRFNIVPRRYFHPLLSDMTAFRHYPAADPLACAQRAARSVLALPSFDSLPMADIACICDVIRALQADGSAGLDLAAAE